MIGSQSVAIHEIEYSKSHRSKINQLGPLDLMQLDDDFINDLEV